MKVILCTRWKDGKSEVHGVYQSTEEFERLNKVRKTPFRMRYNDDKYSYQLEELPFFTNKGTYHSTDKVGNPVLKRTVLTEVHSSVPKKSERNYNFMTLGSASDNYQNNKIATLCGGDFSSTTFKYDY